MSSNRRATASFVRVLSRGPRKNCVLETDVFGTVSTEMFSLFVVIIIIITIQCSHPNLIKRMIPRQHVTRQQRGGGEKEKRKKTA